MDEIILKIENLSKIFRSQWMFRPIPAVKHLSLEVRRGESFGFLGHNGAGKTTSLKCVLGLIHKTTGRITISGEEVRSPEQLSSVGYLPEQPYFYDHLTVGETLDFFAKLYNIRHSDRNHRVSEILERVGLSSRRKNPIRTLSKGLQQRLGLAQAMLNNPKLLLLDEPFSGLDPIGRIEFREILLDLKRQGTTLFLSSHILPDVEDICDRVAIMAHGELHTVFALADAPLLFGESYELMIAQANLPGDFIGELKSKACSHDVEKTNSGPLLILRFDDYRLAQQAMEQAALRQARILHFQCKSLSLEDIFVKITSSAAMANNATMNEETRGVRH